MGPVTMCLTLLGVTAVIGIGSLGGLRRLDGPLPLRRAIVWMYLLTYVASGFAHVLGLSVNRGYYEASAGATAVDRAGLVAASLGTLLGLVSLLVGLYVVPFRGRSREAASVGADTGSWPGARPGFVSQHRGATVVVGAAIAVVGTYGLFKVRGVVAASEATRVIAVDGGMARFANLAQWLPWGVAFCALALVARRPGLGAEMRNACLAAAAMGAGYVSSSWAGGRTDLLLFAVPMLAVMLPHLPTIKWPLALGGGVLGVIVVRAETLARAGVSSFDVWDLLDWQFGRFSMLAFADRYVADHGFIGGETLQTGYLTVPAAVLHLLGIPSSVPTLSIVQVTGQEFAGTNEAIFMVPGMSAELYMNLGYLGVAIGYVVLGLLIAVLGNLFAAASGELARLAIAYVGVVVLMHSVNAQSGAAPQIVLFGGAPLFVFAAVESVTRRWEGARGRHVESSPTLFPSTAAGESGVSG